MVVPLRLRKTNTQPENGSAPSLCRQKAANESIPFRPSMDSTATRIRIWGVICSTSGHQPSKDRQQIGGGDFLHLQPQVIPAGGLDLQNAPSDLACLHRIKEFDEGGGGRLLGHISGERALGLQPPLHGRVAEPQNLRGLVGPPLRGHFKVSFRQHCTTPPGSFGRHQYVARPTCARKRIANGGGGPGVPGSGLPVGPDQSGANLARRSW